jgi:3-oxochol-4-en-24-oyl-CoA dehydrogenase
MQLSLNEDQAMLVESFRRLFEEESSIERVRAAEGSGHDPALWQALGGMGAFAMRLPGDEGFSLFDTWLAMEQAGGALATGPIVETIVATRLLAELRPGDPLIARAAAGEAVLALDLHRAEAGKTNLVPGGAVADAVIFYDGAALRVAHRQPSGNPPANHAGQALEPLDLAGEAGDNQPLAEADVAHAAWQRAIEEWKLLTTATLCGMGRRALELTAAYAGEREQFGRPIGSFQGIAHPLADSATDMEGARLLCWWAIRQLGTGDPDAGAAISAAWWWTAQSARKTVMRALHTLGGYGLSTEYDIQIFHRRALAAALVLGDPADELIEAGKRLWLGTVPALPEAGAVDIDFSLGAEAEAFAEETRDVLRTFDGPEWRAKAHYSFDGHDRDLNQALGARGLLYPTWPKEYGGRDASPYVGATMYATWEEFEASTHAQGVTNMVGHVVIEFGQEALKQEALPRFASGEATASLGYSEPSSGTDVFAARTRAVRDGGDWVINGQKMWTSGAEIAAYCLLLTRTDPDAPKHKGITMFLVPLDTPGIEIHPIHTFQDERTNAVFYSDVRIPDKYRLGEINGGTAILGAALKLEQGGTGFVPHHRRTLEAAVDWAKKKKRSGRPAIEDPRVLERLARVWTRVAISDLLGANSIWSLVERPYDRAAGPMSKLFSSEAFLADATDLFELAAPDTLLRGKHPLGFVELNHRHAAGTTIYGGTSEAQRSLVAEKALSLPRSR